jgi:STE24 endopeptidase
MTHDEIVAVLAHEIGHWKQHHMLKRLIMIDMLMLAGCWFSFLLLQWPGLSSLIGFDNLSFSARLVVLGFITLLIKFPLTPLWAWLCRSYENAADRYACKITGNSEALVSALIKHSAENLSNLHPHPIYARFYFSHPPVVERIRYVRKLNSCLGAVAWQ